MLIRILLMLTLSLSCVFVSAQPSTIRFVIPEFKPFTYSEKGRAAGIGVERVQKTLQQMNWPYRITSVPNYGRALAEVKANRADGFFLASENEERNEFATLSSTVLMNNWSWFYRKDDPAMSGKDFKHLEKIGTILNTNTHKWLKANHYQVSYAGSDPIQLIKLLARSRLQAVFLAESVFLEAQREKKNTPAFNQRVEIEKRMGIYVSKDFLKRHPDFLPSLNKIIEGK